MGEKGGIGVGLRKEVLDSLISEIQDLSKPDLLHLGYPRFPSIGCIPYVFSQQLLAGLRLAKQVKKTFGLVPHACQFQSCMFCHSSFLVVLGVD